MEEQENAGEAGFPDEHNMVEAERGQVSRADSINSGVAFDDQTKDDDPVNPIPLTRNSPSQQIYLTELRSVPVEEYWAHYSSNSEEDEDEELESEAEADCHESTSAGRYATYEASYDDVMNWLQITFEPEQLSESVPIWAAAAIAAPPALRNTKRRRMCGKCGAGYSSKPNSTGHRATLKGVKRNRRARCRKLLLKGKRRLLQQRKRRLFLRKDSTGAKSWVCKVCGAGLMRVCGLVRRMCARKRKQRITCPHCAMSFPQMSDLPAHIHNNHTITRDGGH